jgi:hypothetical protein
MPVDVDFLINSLRGLNPMALRMFKEQLPDRLSEMDDADRQNAIQRLAALPELSDVDFGIARAPVMRQPEPTPVAPVRAAPPIDLNIWANPIARGGGGSSSWAQPVMPVNRATVAPDIDLWAGLPVTRQPVPAPELPPDFMPLPARQPAWQREEQERLAQAGRVGTASGLPGVLGDIQSFMAARDVSFNKTAQEMELNPSMERGMKYDPTTGFPMVYASEAEMPEYWKGRQALYQKGTAYVANPILAALGQKPYEEQPEKIRSLISMVEEALLLTLSEGAAWKGAGKMMYADINRDFEKKWTGLSNNPVIANASSAEKGFIRQYYTEARLGGLETVYEKMPGTVPKREPVLKRVPKFTETNTAVPGQTLTLAQIQSGITGSIQRPDDAINNDYQASLMKATALEEGIKNNKAASFTWLIPKKGKLAGELETITKAQYRRLTGKIPLKNILTDDGTRVKWEYALDDAGTEQGFKNDKDFYKAILKAQDDKRRLVSLKNDVLAYADEMKQSKNDPRAGLYDTVDEAQRVLDLANKVLEFDPENEDAIHAKDIAELSLDDLSQKQPQMQAGTSVQTGLPGMQTKPPQIQMFGELGGAGSGGQKQGLMDATQLTQQAAAKLESDRLRKLGQSEAFTQPNEPQPLVPPIVPNPDESTGSGFNTDLLPIKQAEYDALVFSKAPDTKYRDFFSTAAKDPLRKGETWQGKAQTYLAQLKQRAQAETPAVAPQATLAPVEAPVAPIQPAEAAANPPPPITPSPPVASAIPPVTPPPSNPTLSKIESMWQPQPKKPIDWKDLGRKIEEQLNDQEQSLRTMQTDVAKTTPVIPGSKRDLIAKLTLNPGAASAGVTRYVLALTDIKKKAPNTAISDINTYLTIQHGREVLTEKGANRVLYQNITNVADLDTALVDLQNKLGASKYAELETAAGLVQQVYAAERQRLLESGFITQEEKDVWEQKYPWYNPMRYTIYAEGQAEKGQSSKPFTQKSRGIYALTEKGTDASLQSPMEAMGDQLRQNEINIRRNDMAKTIVGLALENGLDVKKVTGDIGQKKTLSFWDNGERQIYEVPDWVYREAVELTKSSPNQAIAFLSALNGVSRSAFTAFSPPFVVANMANDALTAFESRGIMPHETVIALGRSLRKLENDKVAQAFRLSGAYQQRYYGQSAADMVKAVNKTGGKVVTAKNAAKVIWDAIPTAGEYGEQATRLALFRRELGKNLPGWKNMTSEQIAASPEGQKAGADAVEVTVRFARGGHLMRSINPLVLFLNANMEGLKLPLRALRDNPNARWRLAGTMIAVAALAAYNLSYPEYMDVPETIRWGSIPVMLPSKEKDDRGNPKPNYFTIIPNTREWAAFLGSTTYLMEKMYADAPAEFGQFTKVMGAKLAPFSGIPDTAVMQEIYEQAANYDFYWNEPIVPTEMENQPNSQQVNQYTSRTVTALANSVGLSPLRTQHALSGIFGGAGTGATSISDYVLQLVSPIKADQRISDLADQYKKAERLGKIQILAGLSPNDKEDVLAVANAPKGTIPIVSPIIKRFYPERGGQLYATGARLAEQETGISQKQTADASAIMGKVMDQLNERQKALDKSANENNISWVDWRKQRSSLGTEYAGALKAVGVMFPSAAQANPAEWSNYLDAVNTLAGAIQDRRTRGELLYSASKSIQPVEKAVGVMDWNDYYKKKGEFETSLTAEDKILLEEQEMARMTLAERSYSMASDYLRPYWGLEDFIWAGYDPQIKITADLIAKIGNMDKAEETRLLKGNPAIVAARKAVALAKKNYTAQDPMTRFLLEKYYWEY